MLEAGINGALENVFEQQTGDDKVSVAVLFGYSLAISQLND